MALLECPYNLGVLLGDGSFIGSSSLTSTGASGAWGRISGGLFVELQSHFVKKTANRHLLHSSERKMPKSEVPSHPDFLEWGKIVVSRSQDGIESVQSGSGSSLAEENESREKVLIIFHFQDALAIHMPFGAVVVDPEVFVELPCVGLKVGKVAIDRDVPSVGSML